VIIGGVPMPSLTAMAMGGMFKLAFKGIGKVFSMARGGAKKLFSRSAAETGELASDATTAGGNWKGHSNPGPFKGPNMAAEYVKASQLVDDVLNKSRRIVIGGDEAYKKAVEAELRKVACTPTGRKVIEDIAASPHQVKIKPWEPGKVGNRARPDHAGAYQPGVGSGTTVRFNPDPNCGRYTPNSPPHTSAAHELGHARNNAQGNNAKFNTVPGGFESNKWSNMEEYNNINNVDNPHRREWGLPERTGHDSKP
jgi:hypothetical protein